MGPDLKLDVEAGGLDMEEAWDLIPSEVLLVGMRDTSKIDTKV